MKGTDHFKRTIQMYLEQRAEEDTLFAKNYRNPAKNIDDCVTYILNYVQKSGCNGFTDGEIYGQAVHYYDENEIEVGKPIQCQVAVNHIVELTAEEKAEARQQAVRLYSPPCPVWLPRGNGCLCLLFAIRAALKWNSPVSRSKGLSS